MARDITREALVHARTDALESLESGDYKDSYCCGIPLNGLGQCVHRASHPTVANENMTGYPEAYTDDGKFLNG